MAPVAPRHMPRFLCEMTLFHDILQKAAMFDAEIMACRPDFGLNKPILTRNQAAIRPLCGQKTTLLAARGRAASVFGRSKFTSKKQGLCGAAFRKCFRRFRELALPRNSKRRTRQSANGRNSQFPPCRGRCDDQLAISSCRSFWSRSTKSFVSSLISLLQVARTSFRPLERHRGTSCLACSHSSASSRMVMSLLLP